MHAAQRSSLGAQRIVDLDNGHRDAGCFELLLAEEAGKEAAVVAALLQFDRIGALKWRWMEFHGVKISQAAHCQRRSTGQPACRHMMLRVS